MTDPMLPACAWASVTTNRLRNPVVIWQSPEAHPSAPNTGRYFCRPMRHDALEHYTEESRLELADRYGGTGVGTAGGSGRCCTFNGLQTKGAGVTPLVGPDADRNHSSGILTLVEASLEAVYSGVFARALPYSAVPALAVVLTGEAVSGAYEFEPQSAPPRALLLRPFEVRPAHYLRNILHPAGRVASPAPWQGLTQDAFRVRTTMAGLAMQLQLSLGMRARDPLEALDLGLRELTRRCAWQAAASFAKRIPHGSISCSNIALSGAYIDFGLSGHVDSYRRFTWNPSIPDTWDESSAATRMLANLVGQVRTYGAAARPANFISESELVQLYSTELERRLACEMAKMSGFSEAMVAACPADMVQADLRIKREIWSRGADERCVGFSFPGHSAAGGPMPPPRPRNAFNLTAIMREAGRARSAEELDRVLAFLLPDDSLRARFVRTTDALRKEVAHRFPQFSGIEEFIESEALRKNANLDFLQRNVAFDSLRKAEAGGDFAAVTRIIDSLISHAGTVLADSPLVS